MSLPGLEPLSTYILVFCRVGACLMLMPGFSSLRLPLQIRLLIALAIAISISPFSNFPNEAEHGATLTVNLLVMEVLTGLAMGGVGRIAYSALQFAGSLIAVSMGYSGNSVSEDGTGEVQAEIGALISVSALVLLLVLDLHIMIVWSIVHSFELVPIGAIFDSQRALMSVLRSAEHSLELLIGISAPFILVGFVVNFAFGVLNKSAPQVPVVFVSAPFVLALSLWLLMGISDDILIEATKFLFRQFDRG
mgnify:CR=1 FL=1